MIDPIANLSQEELAPLRERAVAERACSSYPPAQPRGGVFIGIPNYDSHLRCRAAQTLYKESTTRAYMTLPFSSSLLDFNCNAIWCAALNVRGVITDDGAPLQYFAMLHSDIEPEPMWIDALIDELERVGADIISVVVPLKNSTGVTSTAIESADPWRPRRLTLREIADFPETFSAQDIPFNHAGALLVNTGCMVCRFTDSWVERACFQTQNKIHRKPDGGFEPLVFSEDWGFSRFAHAEGLKVFATRKVPLKHFGMMGFPNNEVYGLETDPSPVG